MNDFFDDWLPTAGVVATVGALALFGWFVWKVLEGPPGGPSVLLPSDRPAAKVPKK